MKSIFPITLACIGIFGFTYTFAYKADDNKLHCKNCDGNYFVASRRITKLTGDNENRTVSTGIFYKCSDCGLVSDVKLD